jgi:hypothetical protein
METMKTFKVNVIVIIIVVAFSLSSLAQSQTAAIETAKKIEYNYFYNSLKFLSSDELRGRDTGSEEYAIAADYVVKEFKQHGLKPFGDDGTFFQKVPLIKRSFVKSSINLYADNGKKKLVGKYGENYTLLVNTKFKKIREEQNLVFVGYGNILPEKNINDYKGVDVKGKTVIVVIGSPDTVRVSGAYDPFVKVQNAVSQGADGIILFFPNSNLLQGLIFKQMHGFLKEPIISQADTSVGGSMFDIDLKIATFAKKKLISKVFKLNNLKLKKELKKISKGEFASKELRSTLNVSYDIKVENNDCKNVVAVLPGTDPKLKSEYVVIGGHLDHVGVGEEIKGDSIYNGMWDNATGISAIMSIAKTYNELSEKPKRSIVFICYTGEEKGLLGSNYYAQKNDIKDGKIVANLNIDMLGSLFEAKDVIPLGYSHSNLSEAVDFSTKSLGLDIDENLSVENMYIERSDQMSFIEIGVPVLNIGNGFTAVDPKIDGKKFDDKWMEKFYHSPFDDINQKFNGNAFLTSLKMNFLTLYYITNVMEEIKWNEESKFYKKYVLK